MSSKGFEIGTGQSGTTLPGNLPPDVKARIASLAHDVFVTAYLDAMKNTFVVPIVVLLLTSLTTLLIKRRPRAASASSPDAPRQDEVRAATG